MLLSRTQENLTVITHDSLSREILKGNYKSHIEPLFEKIITKDHIVVEAGAYIGTLSTRLAKKARKVYAFEPCSISFEILKKNISEQKLNNVVLSSIALGEVFEKEIYMYIPRIRQQTSFISTASLHKKDHREELRNPCVVFPLDAFKNNFQALDLILLDTDQNDVILKGGKEIIEKYRPHIVCLNYSTHETCPNWLSEWYTKITLSTNESDYLFIPLNKLENYAHQ